MVRSSYLAQSAIAVFLMAAPIGDTTVLLLFSLSLECLLVLMLVSHRCVTSRDPGPRWRKASREATS
jgi:hypothetical protein